MGCVNPRSDRGSSCRNVVSPATTGDTITTGVVEARAGGEGTRLPPEEDVDIKLQDEETAEDYEKKNESEKENQCEEYIEESDISLLAIPSTPWATENDDYTHDIDYDIDDIQ